MNVGVCDAVPNQSIDIQYCGRVVKQEFANRVQSYQRNPNIEKSIAFMFPADT
jgi:hypothetical protein